MIGMNRTTGRTVADHEHLSQSITDILTTPIGSRVMRRTYGSLLFELIDQPDNGTTRVKLYAATAGALMRWEKRIKLSRVQLFAGERKGQLILDLAGLYIAPGQQSSVLSMRVPLQVGAAA